MLKKVDELEFSSQRFFLQFLQFGFLEKHKIVEIFMFIVWKIIAFFQLFGDITRDLFFWEKRTKLKDVLSVLVAINLSERVIKASFS